MPVVNELIRSEADGAISFGNYKLDTKSKLPDFEHCGDTYKVKTFNEITKLEKNGSFVYESVPGTAVNDFKATDTSVSFMVEGNEDAQITLALKKVHHMISELTIKMQEQWLLIWVVSLFFQLNLMVRSLLK